MKLKLLIFGLLEEYHNKKLGSLSFIFSDKIFFLNKTERVWVHTCSLDHKNALQNYLSRGMRIFKKETISI